MGSLYFLARANKIPPFAVPSNFVISQVEEFNKIIPLTGLIMTKLDGTAKGGILLALAKKYKDRKSVV